MSRNKLDSRQLTMAQDILANQPFGPQQYIHWVDPAYTIAVMGQPPFPPGAPRFMYRIQTPYDPDQHYPFLFHHGSASRKMGFYAIVPNAELGEGLFLYRLDGGGYESISPVAAIDFLYHQPTSYAPILGLLNKEDVYIAGYDVQDESTGLVHTLSARLYMVTRDGESLHTTGCTRVVPSYS